jgi:hypothetical protein
VDVRCCDFDLWEGVEDVEFGKVEGSVTIYFVAVFDDDKVEPATAAFTSSLVRVVSRADGMLSWR